VSISTSSKQEVLTETFSGSALRIFESGKRRFISSEACASVATSEQTVAVCALTENDALKAINEAVITAAVAVFFIGIIVNSRG